MLENQEHLTELAGKTVLDWVPEIGLQNLAETIYRVGIEDEGEEWPERFARFLQEPAIGELTGLVVGMWSTEVMEIQQAKAVVETLVAARSKLSRLKVLFMGDIIAEENEVSWIEQTDVTPLLEAYPALEYFGLRGSQDLRLGQVYHAHLRQLVMESGSLPRKVVQSVLRADLPELEHLELWLGSSEYADTIALEDLAPLFQTNLFPKLRYLGLRDSEIADQIAAALINAPILERLETLDLSLGILTDTGALALLQNPLIHKLKKLDLHHHYCSDEMIARLNALDIAVDTSQVQTPHVYRWKNTETTHLYVALSE